MAEQKSEQHKHPQRRTTGLSTKYFRDIPLSELTLYEISKKEAPANPDAYFGFRSPPNSWSLFIQHHQHCGEIPDEIPQPHLFLHAFMLARDDEALIRRNKNRAKVFAISDDRDTPKATRDLLTAWLSDRPAFLFNRVARHKRRYQWNAWDKEVRAKMVNMAADTGVSAAILFIIYSVKSLATSYSSPHIDDLMENVVAEWDRWLEQENKDLEELLATITH